MLATFLLLLIPTLARLPERWEALALGQTWALRIALIVAALWLLMQLRAIVYAALPGAVVLSVRRIRIPGRLRGRWLKIDTIRRIHVDLRPEGEVFVLELDDGSELDMCGVDWEGAGRLYQRLATKVRRRRKARQGRDSSRGKTASAKA